MWPTNNCIYSKKTVCFFLISTLLLLCVPSDCQFSPNKVKSYRGYQVIEFQPQSLDDLSLLRSFDQVIDFLSIPKLGHKSTASVSPAQLQNFKYQLLGNKIQFSIKVNDLENVIEKERRTQLLQSFRRSRYLSFNTYPRYNQILSYLDRLANKYPELVTVVTQATTIEGRPIKYIRISNNTDGHNKKRTIIIDAGVHSREWIAAPTALYVIKQLVENTTYHVDLINQFDWIILPMVNPDGHEHSHTTDRMWRKTRSSQTSACKGVDGNRNFDFKWGHVGTSSNACSDIFRGVKPFSEVETRAVRDILQTYKSTCKMYLSLHSYGSYLIYPWGYTSDLPDTWRDLDEVARAGANAIKAATGRSYQVGSSTNVLYAASGASDDYAFAVAKIPIAMTMELPGGGLIGFDLPSKLIRATVEEAWIGIRAMADKVNMKY